MPNSIGPDPDPDPGQRRNLVLPQVRYHPSIQTPVARPQISRARPGDPPQTRSQHLDSRDQEDPVGPGGKSQETQNPPRKPKPGRKLLVPNRPDPDAAQDPDQTKNRVDPGPEWFPPRMLDPAKVEILTRGQRENPAWFSWRQNRITASVAHRIAHCRFVHGLSQTPPASYLKAITGEGQRVQTRAMSWGIDMEAVAVRQYQKMKSAAMSRRVTVQDCGLFIDAGRPWLAASPDGLVTDGRSQWLLEVKCPYKHRDSRVEDACKTDSAFCLEIQDATGSQPESSVYRLKTSHSYFTQIQVQLAVTGLTQADLVVYTTKETAIVPVTFDPELWEETVSMLEVFYRDALLPHLNKERSAAWTPEQ